MGRDIGKKIKKLRQQRGLSQSALAQMSGIAQSTLSYLESGKKAPQFDTLTAICRGLDMSVLELLSHDEPKSNKKLFEQPHSFADGCINIVFKKELPVDAQKELYAFQQYLYHKYNDLTVP